MQILVLAPLSRDGMIRDVIGAGANNNAPKNRIARALPGQKCVARAMPGQSVSLYVICPYACP